MIKPIPGVSRSGITTESWPTEGVNLRFDAQEGVRIGRDDELFHREGIHVRWISWWEWVNMVHPSVWSIPSRSASSHEEVNEASKNTTSTSGEIGDDYSDIECLHSVEKWTESGNEHGHGVYDCIIWRKEDQKMMAEEEWRMEEWRAKTRSASSKHTLSSFELSQCLRMVYGNCWGYITELVVIEESTKLSDVSWCELSDWNSSFKQHFMNTERSIGIAHCINHGSELYRTGECVIWDWDL